MESLPINTAQTSNEEIPSKPEKVTFSKEQQERIDAIVKGSMGRAASELRTNLSKVTAEKAQLEADLAAAKASNQPDLEVLEQIHNESRQKDRELADLRKIVTDQRLDAVILKASQGKGFVDLEAVKELTKGLVKMNHNGQVSIVDEAGNERLNSDHKPMSLSEFYSEWAISHPFLVKSDVKGGAGSSQNQKSNFSGKYDVTQIFGPKSSPALANKLAKENLPEYHRLKAAAKEAGLVA